MRTSKRKKSRRRGELLDTLNESQVDSMRNSNSVTSSNTYFKQIANKNKIYNNYKNNRSSSSSSTSSSSATMMANCQNGLKCRHRQRQSKRPDQIVINRSASACGSLQGLAGVNCQQQQQQQQSIVIECCQRSANNCRFVWPSKLVPSVIRLLPLLLLATNLAPQPQQVEGLQITNFRVPSFVPSNLPTTKQQQQQQQQHQQSHQPAQLGDELTKPILFDCDYEYRPEEDARLTVRWFKNKEAEPFYQWLPELNVRHFADWIKPLISQSFVSDPHDPMKRYRSLLIRRLSMNLTGQYTCLVSSLAGQDTRQASLVVYQQPRSFTFEHRILTLPAAFISGHAPAPASAPANSHALSSVNHLTNSQPTRFNPATNWNYNFNNQQQQQQVGGQIGSGQSGAGRAPTAQLGDSMGVPVTRAPPNGLGASPTQFKGLAGATTATGANQLWPATIVLPPNNNQQQQQQQQEQSSLNTVTTAPSQVVQATTKIVYTHDGRPIRRKYKRQQQHDLAMAVPAPIPVWQLKKKLGGGGDYLDDTDGRDSTAAANDVIAPIRAPAGANQNYAIQLHYLQCQASQVTPRPVVVLKVRRDADSIVQYLHESSSVSIRPYQVSQSELFALSSGASGASSSNITGATGGHYRAGSEQLATNSQFSVTLYDITVSATVALNVSLAPVTSGLSGALDRRAQSSEQQLAAAAAGAAGAANSFEHQFQMQQQQQPFGIHTILNYKRGQRMLFECHLEISGTDFEARQKISINETEVYQFAEAEEERRKLRLQQKHAQYDQFNQQSLRNKIHDSGGGGQSTADQNGASLLFGFGFGSSSAATTTTGNNNNNNNKCLAFYLLQHLLIAATLWSFQTRQFAI